MGLLFKIEHPTDLSEYTTNSAGTGVTFSRNASGLGGTSGKGVCTLASGAKTAGYLEKTHTALVPATDTHYGFLFYIDSGWNTLTMGASDGFHVMRFMNSTSIRGGLEMKMDAGTRKLFPYVRDDSNVDQYGGNTGFALSGVTYLYVLVTRAANASSNDGKMEVFLNKVTGSPDYSITGVDVYNVFNYDRIRWGAVASIDTGTEGAIGWDQISVRNDNTAPTPEGDPPVNTVPGTQTCSIGVQKAVTEISVADSGSNLSSITVSCVSPQTVDVTNLSSCTVTAGSRNSQSFKIEGSQANLNTAIGTLVTDFPVWSNEAVAPVLSVSQDITILSSDGTDTDSDTIQCDWSLAAGDGTTRLTLDNATVSGINSEIATSYYIPVTDFIGTTYVYVKVTDGNANTDEVIVPVVVTNTGITIDFLQTLYPRRRRRR